MNNPNIDSTLFINLGEYPFDKKYPDTYLSIAGHYCYWCGMRSYDHHLHNLQKRNYENELDQENQPFDITPEGWSDSDDSSVDGWTKLVQDSEDDDEEPKPLKVWDCEDPNSSWFDSASDGHRPNVDQFCEEHAPPPPNEYSDID